ncbi:hypothetical protein [uncultured Cohaesibacter sp.]|nr:hypothetical protein [uncultured Cohaesibacter sp.]
MVYPAAKAGKQAVDQACENRQDEQGHHGAGKSLKLEIVTLENQE